jgi:hypothetical protein
MNFITIDCFPKIEHSLNRVENKGNKTARKIFGEGASANEGGFAGLPNQPLIQMDHDEGISVSRPVGG